MWWWIGVGWAASVVPLMGELQGADDDGLGAAMVGADVDGDRDGDLVLLAPGARELWVLPGTPAGPEVAALLRLTTGELPADADLVGGDVDGDRSADLAWRAVEGGRIVGHLLRGVPGGPAFGHATRIADPDGALARLGMPGDLDGDGAGELVALSARADGAWLCVWWGRAGDAPEAPDHCVPLSADSVLAGAQLAPAGDLDADGRAELLVSEPHYADGTGRATWWTGEAVLTGEPVWFDAPEVGTRFGVPSPRAGDVDRDGVDDLVLSAPGFHGGGGRIYTWYGHPGFPPPVPDARFDPADGRGSRAAIAGDFNGDRGTDLIVWPERGAGPVDVWRGERAGWNAPKGYTAPEPRWAAGDVVVVAVDLHGDGDHELAVADPAARDGAGAVWLYDWYGELEQVDERAIDGDLDGAALDIDCDDRDPGRSPRLAEAPGDGVDQDCDGVDPCWEDRDGDRAHGGVMVYSGDGACDGPGEADADAVVGECDDDDPAIGPRMPEIPGDGIDQDCDGQDAVPASGCAWPFGGAAAAWIAPWWVRRRRDPPARAQARPNSPRTHPTRRAKNT